MGILVAAGFELLIGAAVGLVIFIIGLFFGYITVFDSIALGVVGGFVTHGVFRLHPGWTVLIGIVIFAALLFIQFTGPGFWIVGGLLSIIWGFIFSLFAYSMSGESMAWTIGVWIAGTVVMLLLHLRARDNMMVI